MKILQFLKENFLIAAILVLAAALRFYHVGFQDMWIDELHTMIAADPGLTLGEFHRLMLAREGMGHLYFMAVRILHELFGYVPLTSRVFSAVIGTATILAMYLLGKALYSRRSGLIGALLLTINYFHITYSQEARPYALLVLFTVVSFYTMMLYIKKPSVKNAIIFGISSGLIVNAHFVGLVTVFSQFLLLLFMIITAEKENRGAFFKSTFIAGVAALLFMLPTWQMFFKMSQYRSGWLQLPGAGGFTGMLRQFLGATEMLYFIFSLIIIFYFISVFRQKETGLSWASIRNNRLLFSGLLLFSWIFLSFPISILKSYLSEPMILPRYFIHVMPAFIMIVAIGIDLIGNQLSRALLLVVIITFSLIDIIVVKDYYHKVSKTQFSELTAELNQKNESNDMIISAYGWLMANTHYKGSDTKVIEMPFETHIDALRKKIAPEEPFWYLDANSRPYNLAPEYEKYLLDHFKMDKAVQRYDVWAYHYTPKNKGNGDPAVYLSRFTPSNRDNYGNLYIFNKETITHPKINFDKGSYTLIIEGNSYPEKPVLGENAHITITLGGKQLSSLYLSEKKEKNFHSIPFTIKTPQKAALQISFDNDTLIGKDDRNVMFTGIKIEKQK